MEQENRSEFVAIRSMYVFNMKLRHQFEGVRNYFGKKNMDFESPLQKATSLLKSIMNFANMGDETHKAIIQVHQLLTSANLNAPDIEKILRLKLMAVDTEQEVALCI